AALQSDGLRLHFQPQVDVAAPNAIVGFEALLRWPDSGSPQIAPSTFVPVAEQTGLIVPIGLWALRQACLQAVEWQRRGYPPARMAVNVAAAQFARPDFVASVRRVLDETGLDASLLELEVTEGSVMRDIEEVTTRLNELRELGVTIAVDDFGTGYSSLAYLNRLPFDALKVDRSFVRSLAGREAGGDHVLVGAIVQLGRNLNKIVIAEGIETVEQLDRLRGLGCDVGQGYLFARPISAEDATRLLGRGSPDDVLRVGAR
ncbi:MAG TPA: EAL domain-containing protein, partial [Streptosporangiaceae bacterium]|nr:EAL domain-containing protein [Streptosporangiaceae bacterium]